MMAVLKKILNMIHSIIFNFRAFPIEVARKLPIKIAYDTKIDYIRKGCIQIEGDIHRSMIKIGVTGLEGVTGERKSHIRFGKESTAKVIFKGDAVIARGALLAVDRGTLIFGKGFSANNNFYVSCNDRIEFGDSVMIGWEVKVRDSDNHVIIEDGKEKKSHAPVRIHERVWIASYCDILKGAEVGEGSVVAYRALVTKAYEQSNCMLAGAPAKVIAEKIDWKM